MTIQLNTDKNLQIDSSYSTKLKDLLSDELSRFDDYITRVEVHLSDENADKKSKNDKRCLLEARIAGKQPIAVSEYADTFDLAVTGAIDKLIATLETIKGRMKQY